MQLFSTWPERQARLVRWVLLLGWLLLIGSLFLPDGHGWPILRDPCPSTGYCGQLHNHSGNRVFWGSIVPLGIMIIVGLSHELWRRICPLAFISQLFRAIGRQRTQLGKGGKREVVKVRADSWLGRHHLQLQWSLFIAGLCLRLLVVNSSPMGLGVFLTLTVVAALVVGWAYAGKAWCHYVCPMGPVQTVLIGPRSLAGGPAHIGTNAKITQSMCRTIGTNQKEQSACVACQSPCIDIDSERQFWQNFSGTRGLTWAWWSYPGLVLVFFLLLDLVGDGDLNYLRSGRWAYDSDLVDNLGSPLGAPFQLGGLPRLLSIPLLLVGGAAISICLFSTLERRGLGQLRSRLLASFVAINLFFWFADPSLGLLGPGFSQIIRSLVLVISAMALYRHWNRDKSYYNRESTSNSLRKQLSKQLADQETLLPEWLDGRSLDQLSPDEVFTLAKVLPAHRREDNRKLYKNVVEDLYRSGRLERAASLLQLEELRSSLGLEEQDHHGVVHELALADPQLLALDERQSQRRNLREEAATEAITDFMEMAGLVDLDPDRLSPKQASQLETIRRSCGLDDIQWQATVAQFSPSSPYHQERLAEEYAQFQAKAAAHRGLVEASRQEPLLQPLLPVLNRQLEANRSWLIALGCPPSEIHALEQGNGVGGSQDAQLALQLLWQDHDPDTAGWVLWVQRRLNPDHAGQLQRQSRLGRPTSAFLDGLLADEPWPQEKLLEQFIAVPLLLRLEPASLLEVARVGEPRHWAPGKAIYQEGEGGQSVLILLTGDCLVVKQAQADAPAMPRVLATITAGETVGEMAFFTGARRSADVLAGDHGASGLWFSQESFDHLFSHSSQFSRELLRELALRLQAANQIVQTVG